jgi:hypothetical protein
LRQIPPTTSRSSLQSNWNASPSSNFSGTKARVDIFAEAR